MTLALSLERSVFELKKTTNDQYQESIRSLSKELEKKEVKDCDIISLASKPPKDFELMLATVERPNIFIC